MDPLTSPGPGRVGRAPLAVAMLFFVNGATFSNWLPRIPEVRDHLGVDNAGLGAALVGGGLGGLVMSLVVGRLLGRYGSRRCVTVAASALALCLPLIALAPTAVALAAVLTGLGALDVVNDLAMNTQGVAVQQRLGRSIMQRLHGGWSLGFLSGAAVGSVAGAARLDIRVHLVLVSAVLLSAVQLARPALLSDDRAAEGHGPDGAAPAPGGGAPAPSPRRRRPSAAVVAMAVMACGVAFVEGMPNDWSAVTLHDAFGLVRFTGAGALLYAGAMLAGRLVGDHAVDRLGAGRVLDLALGAAAVGIVAVAAAPVVGVALVGFVVWGLGVSVLFPQLYTLGGTLPGSSAGAGLAAMAMGQRIGFLAEPMVVGALSEAATLRTALAVVGATGLALTMAARRSVGQHGAVARRAQPARNIR